eukprot:TRINITY_DN3209_c1_g3_i1.p1 TRINITY_DN3209_c1_g3~~TRINITY_DN3209_c1_g3_i1.p1  ORF type:complete len:1831 (+),score=403.60 TRINITY_DN3209_c1_g3_i1:51-5543(+)
MTNIESIEVIGTKEENLEELQKIPTDTNDNDKIKDTTTEKDSLFPKAKDSSYGWRHLCYKLVNLTIFEIAIQTVIILNIVSVILPLNSDSFDDTNIFFRIVNYFVDVCFTFEAIFKILGMGFTGPENYFSDNMNIMDFLIVLAVLVVYLPFVYVDISTISMLRVIRLFRIFTHVSSVKRLLRQLMHATELIADTFFLLGFIFTIIAIAALHLFSGTFHYRCVTDQFILDHFNTVENVSYTSLANNFSSCHVDSDCSIGSKCMKVGTNPNSDTTSFDDIGHSIVTVFQIVSLEGWSPIMNQMKQSASDTMVEIFFYVVIVFCSFVMVNMFVGAISDSFATVTEDDSEDFVNKLVELLTPQRLFNLQVLGIDIREESHDLERSLSDISEVSTIHESHIDSISGDTKQILSRSKLSKSSHLFDINSDRYDAVNPITVYNDQLTKSLPKQSHKLLALLRQQYPSVDTINISQFVPPKRSRSIFSRFRFACYEICIATWFDTIVLVFIFLNLFILCTSHEGMGESFRVFIDVTNQFFNCFYIFEMVLKHIGFGFIQYWTDGWNILDGITTITGIFEILFMESSVITSIRALRAFRVLRLLRTSESIQTLVHTLMLSLQDLISFIILFVFIVFIFACFGLIYFRPPIGTNAENVGLSFSSIIDAMLIIFAIFTGENWNDYMVMNVENAGENMGILFTMLAYVVGNWVLVNVLVTMVINRFATERREAYVKKIVLQYLNTDVDSITDPATGLKLELQFQEEFHKDVQNTMLQIQMHEPDSADQHSNYAARIITYIDKDVSSGIARRDSFFVWEREGQLKKLNMFQVDNVDSIISSAFSTPNNSTASLHLNKHEYPKYTGNEEFVPFSIDTNSNLSVPLLSDNNCSREATPLSQEFSEMINRLRDESSSDSSDNLITNISTLNHHSDNDNLDSTSQFLDELNDEREDENSPNEPEFQASGNAHELSHLNKSLNIVDEESNLSDYSDDLGDGYVSDCSDRENDDETIAEIITQTPDTSRIDVHENLNFLDKVVNCESSDEEIGQNEYHCVNSGQDSSRPNTATSKTRFSGIENEKDESKKVSLFEIIIILVVLFNCGIIIVDAQYENEQSFGIDHTGSKNVLYWLDNVCLIIFVFEMFYKMKLYGIKGYFFDSWNFFDFIIVVVSIPSALPNFEFGFIRTFRVLRTLKTLRVLSVFKSLRLVTTAMISSFSVIVQMSLIILFIMVIFALLGMTFFQGHFYTCSDETIITMDKCVGSFFNNKTNLTENRTIIDPAIHMSFDNFGRALVTLFGMLTLEAWPDLLTSGVFTSTEAGVTLFSESRRYVSVYFIAYVLICSFLLLNMFVGVVVDSFSLIMAKTKGQLLFNENQKSFIQNIEYFVKKAKPIQIKRRDDSNKVFFAIKTFLESKILDFFIMFCVIGNAFVLMLHVDKIDPDLDSILGRFNLGFSILFIFESAFKMIFFGLTVFFANYWNAFDFFLVLVSLPDIFFQDLNLPLNVFRVLRLMRVLRLFKLSKSIEGIRKVFNSFVKSIPSLGNICVLILLFLITYSAIAMVLFGKISYGENITELENFQTFRNALALTFKILTLENWQGIMLECQSVSTFGAILYFITFILIGNFIILSYLIGIVIEAFSTSHENVINVDIDVIHVYEKVWAEHDPEGTGKLHFLNAVNIYRSLPRPLGNEGVSFRQAYSELIAIKNDWSFNKKKTTHLVFSLSIPLVEKNKIEFYTFFLGLLARCYNLPLPSPLSRDFYGQFVGLKNMVTKDLNICSATLTDLLLLQQTSLALKYHSFRMNPNLFINTGFQNVSSDFNFFHSIKRNRTVSRIIPSNDVNETEEEKR